MPDSSASRISDTTAYSKNARLSRLGQKLRVDGPKSPTTPLRQSRIVKEASTSYVNGGPIPFQTLSPILRDTQNPLDILKRGVIDKNKSKIEQGITAETINTPFSNGWTALTFLATRSEYHLIEHIFHVCKQKGISLDLNQIVKGQSALAYALMSEEDDSFECVKTLINLGADIHLTVQKEGKTNGFSPLMLAVWNNDQEAVTVLLEHNAPVDADVINTSDEVQQIAQEDVNDLAIWKNIRKQIEHKLPIHI